MYEIYFYNFGYYHQDVYQTLEEAKSKAVFFGFDCVITRNGATVASYTTIGGWK